MPEAQVRITVPTAPAKQGIDRIRAELRLLASDAQRARSALAALSVGGRGGSTTAVQAHRQLAQVSRQNEAALIREERALQRAHQQLLNIQAAVARSGAQVGSINQLTAAYQRLEAVVARGHVSMLDLSRAQASFTAAAGQVRRELAAINAQQAQQRLAGLTAAVNTLTTASILVAGPLSGIGARLSAINVLASRGTLAIGLMIGGVAALAAGTVSLGRALVTTNLEMTRTLSTLRAVTGSTERAEAAMSFVLETARELGLSFGPAVEQFARLAAAARGTALEGRGVRDLFVAMGEAATVLGLSTQDTEGALRALQQMLSKGKITAEEWNQQFGERLPGATQILAKELGVTTRELFDMMEQGDLLVDTTLPKLAEGMHKAFGAEAQQAASNVRQEINRVATEWQNLLRVLERGRAGGLLGSVLRGVSETLQGISESLTPDELASADLLARRIADMVESINRLRGLSGALGTGFGVEAELARREAELERLRTLLRQRLRQETADVRLDITGGPANVLSRENQDALRDLRQELALISTAEADRELLRISQRLDDLVRKAGPASAEARKLADEILRLTTLERHEHLRRDLLGAAERQIGLEAFGGTLTEADVLRAIEERRVELGLSEGTGIRARTGAAEFARLRAQAAAEAAIPLEAFGGVLPFLSLEDILDHIQRDQRLAVQAAREAQIPLEAFGGELIPDVRAVRFRGLERENQLIEEQIAGRRINARVMEIENELRDQGLTLTASGREELRKLLEEQDRLTRSLEQQREFVQSLRQAWTSAFEDVGQAIVQAFVLGKREAVDFGRIGEAVLASLINQLLQFAAIRPLTAALFGTDPNVLGGALGAFGRSLSGLLGGGGIGAAQTGASSVAPGGFAATFQHGTVLTGLTYLFGGRRGIAGEAGPEAILPLRRLPSGDLGVAAMAGGVAAPQVIVTINNNVADAQVTASPPQRLPDGRTLFVLSVEQTRQAIEAGLFDRQLGRRYGLGPRP